ncbi:hypothetical protein BDN70DRAFT_704585 [Pholiota conissans]|uniref:DUF6604 domain-containing protein n=1 Tax=Pholiota conissans TaxID=109636 RepID=A0A9P5ZEJ1_9AGAR|nr:hypothetical protein BDN70DRAFT_704585 [Pholiota conissans]
MVSKSSRGPRLSEWYRSSYDQYKENDSRLLFWVHRTVAEIRRVRSPCSTSTRSNGRAQRNKAHNENAKNYVTMDPDFASPKISFSQLIVFAKEIAASNVTIPMSYLRLLYLSIKLRKRLAAFYSPDAGVDAEKKNSSHLHAIKQYSQVWEILKEAEERRTKKEGKDKFLHSFTVGDDPFALSEAIEQASAVFDKELSEDNEWVRDNPLIRSTAKTIYKQEIRNTFPLEEYELVVDDDDETKTKIFTHISSGAEDALRCFLVDLWDIRRYCDDIWLSVVPVGKTSHLAASFITNKAVAMVEEMEYNLLANFPMLKDLHQCYQDLDRVIKAATESFDDAHHRAEAAHRLSSQTMANTFNFLENFGKILKDGLTPAIREGAFGYFDPLANRDCMTSDDKTMEEKCIGHARPRTRLQQIL